MKKIINTKNLRKISAVSLSVILLAMSIFSVQASEIEEIKDEQNIYIEERLKTIMEKAEADDLIPVDIWLWENGTKDLETKVREVVGINRADVALSELAKSELWTDEKDSELIKSLPEITGKKIDAYIETKRAMYAEIQFAENMDFIQNYQGTLKQVGKDSGIYEAIDGNSIFISKYSPLVSLKLTRSEIQKISEDSRSAMIYYSPDVTFESTSNVSIPLVRADYTRDTLGYTGSGIKIGLLEVDGMPNINESCFASSTIYLDTRDTVYQGTHFHPSAVASVMVSNYNGPYKGIVPNATLYATNFSYGAYNEISEWRDRIEWLISQGVNVINMSCQLFFCGDDVCYGEYGINEKWLDHLAINHSVHFVAAAGNYKEETGNDNYFISSPAMAYNAITVGSINDNNTATHSDDTRSTFSKYLEYAGQPNKPDIMAPGENITTQTGSFSGTSFSAPHVTAIAAQLMQQQPALKVLQDAMKAILTAGISHSIFSHRSLDPLFEYNGAGMVDARSASYIVTNNRYTSTAFAANSANGTYRDHYFNVSSSDDLVRISLAWLKYNQSSSHAGGGLSIDGRMAHLTFEVFDPNGVRVDWATRTNTNLQIAKFVPTVTGTYRIRVTQVSNSDRAVYYSLAWW